MPMSTSNESAVEMVRSEQPCLNCGAPMLGEFCYACGQPKKGMIRHLPELIADFFDSVFNLDTRTLRTLGPLLTGRAFSATNTSPDGARAMSRRCACTCSCRFSRS